jgi:hypothetical protein
MSPTTYPSPISAAGAVRKVEQDAFTLHFQGRDRVAESAAASADRTGVHRCMCPSCHGRRADRPMAATPKRPLVHKPREQKSKRAARGAYFSGAEAAIIAARRNGGALELVAQDAGGRNFGIARTEGVWLCQCAPEWENPGCRHQRAAEGWREAFS